MKEYEKMSKEELIKIIEEKKEIIKNIKLLFQMVRHDIINILSVIQSALNIYNRNKDKDMLDEMTKNIKLAVKEFNRTRLLEKMIIEHDLKKYNTEEIFNTIIAQYDIIIKVENSASAELLVDEAIYSIFINIINNAIHHGKADFIKINIKEDKKNKKTIIEIFNNGQNIDLNIIDHIFDKGIKDSKTGNTGLGLFIVKESMIRYEGDINVKNTKGGVIFTLIFPEI